jgi:hypothetical protein
MVDTNPEILTFYPKISGFNKVAETFSTPSGITNHYGHPLHYPNILRKASNTHLLLSNTMHQI